MADVGDGKVEGMGGERKWLGIVREREGGERGNEGWEM